jgi:peptidoglycan/xylan/chitin deacetylase (PgdA/CDA1 family)
VIGALRRQLKSVVKDTVYRALPRSRLVQRGSADRRQVALTFDDGPDQLTLAYLDLLDELHVKATFFVLGNMCERQPELTREYVRRGHQVASHGYDHTHFTRLPWRGLSQQLERTDELLEPRATARPWVRPPYGNVDARVLAHLLASGKLIALWSLDSHDYETRNAAEVVTRCAPSHVSSGEVILFHEGQTWTLEALPRIVGGLREAGYEMVTMAEMFGQE